MKKFQKNFITGVAVILSLLLLTVLFGLHDTSLGQYGTSSYGLSTAKPENYVKYYGATGKSDGANYIIQSSIDSSYIIAGYTASWGAGGLDGWVMSLNGSGDTMWTRSYGGSSDDAFHSVTEIPDSGYMCVGYTKSWGAGNKDIWVVRITYVGDTVFTKVTGGASDDELYCVTRDAAGYYIACGHWDASSSDQDAWMMKFNTRGDTSWTKFVSYDGANPYRYEEFIFVSQVYDGNYVSVGQCGRSGVTGGNNSGKVWVYKFNTNGVVVAADTFGERTAGKFSIGRHFAQSPTDSHLFIVGPTGGSTVPPKNILLLEVDENVDSVTSHTFAYCNLTAETATRILNTPEGGYIIVGDADADCGIANHAYFIVRTNSKGDSVGYMLYDPSYLYADILTKAIFDFEGNVVIVGYSTALSGIENLYDATLIKFGYYLLDFNR